MTDRIYKTADRINALADDVYQNAVDKGFYDVEFDDEQTASMATILSDHSLSSAQMAMLRGNPDVTYMRPHWILDNPLIDGRTLATLNLIHSEVDELSEALMLRPWSHVINELADIILMTLSLAKSLDIDIGAAVVNKHQHNTMRPHLNGKRF